MMETERVGRVRVKCGRGRGYVREGWDVGEIGVNERESLEEQR